MTINILLCEIILRSRMFFILLYTIKSFQNSFFRV